MAWGVLPPKSLRILFFYADPHVSLLVFLLVSAPISDENRFRFNRLWY
jgi:hypothetical protein